MRLHKALKEKNKLVSRINKTKELIRNKNIYKVGSKSSGFDVNQLYKDLLLDVEKLTNLKLMINTANSEIQSKIYMISEYKALIDFLKSLPIREGEETYPVVVEYASQIDEMKKIALMGEYENIIERLQEEIDQYNYNTDIPWE